MRKLIASLLVMGIMIISSAVALAHPLQIEQNYEFNKIGEGYTYSCHYDDGDRDYAPYGGCYRYH